MYLYLYVCAYTIYEHGGTKPGPYGLLFFSKEGVLLQLSFLVFGGQSTVWLIFN